MRVLPRACGQLAPSLRFRRSAHEAIAHLAHGQEVLGAAGIALDLLADAADVHVEQAAVALLVVAPDQVDQFVAGEDAAGMAGQGGEDVELGAREMDRPTVTSRVERERVIGPKWQVSAEASASEERRSTARTRATSSRGLKGFTT